MNQPIDPQLAAVRLPPHSIEAEQSVLGGLLLDNTAWDRIADLIGTNDFYRQDHQYIFGAISRLVDASKPADSVTVFEALRNTGRAEQAGGLVYLNSLAQNTPSAANIRRYAELVRERSVLRRLVTAGDEIATSALNPAGKDTKQILDEAETKVFQIAEEGARGRQGFIEIQPLLTRVVERIQELFERANPSDVTGVPSGFADLDSKTSGFQAGDLIIIAGRPSMGKTALALNIGEHVALDQGMPVAVFSMEMGASQLALRMLSSVGKLDQQRLRTGRLQDDDWPRLTSAIQKMHEAPLYIDETAAMTSIDLRARARRLARTCGRLGLIIVDYLQLMSASAAGENRATEISEISRGLKALAKELAVPVIALSQLNRTVETRVDKRPVMSDLRESGAIEQDADVILFIYRDEVYNPDTTDKNIAEIIIGKQRNGPIGRLNLRFDGQYTKFENLAAQYSLLSLRMTLNFVPEQRSPRPLRSVLRRLVPRDRRFYSLFDRHAELCVEGVTALAQLLSDVRDPDGRVREIEALEKRADTVVDDTLALVRRSLLPPFPRRAIHALINRLDDILDLTEDVAQSLHLYHVTTLTPDAHRLAALAVQGADKLRLAVAQLQSVDDPRAALALCQEVDELEAQADHVMRAAMSKLFRDEADTRQLVKLRAIYELLEQLTDACKHAAAEVQALALR